MRSRSARVRTRGCSPRGKAEQLGKRRHVAVRVALEPRMCGEVDGRPFDRDDDVPRLPLKLVPALQDESSFEASARLTPQDSEHTAPCYAREARRRRYGPVAES